MPEEDEMILLKGVNTPEPQSFRIGHEKYRIGTDGEQADGVISGVNTVSPVHAVVGWNDISFYVMDLDSANGTFVNDQKIAPMSQVPIGKGSVLRFADCTFNVE
ncbi:FHA domain-containing protein [Lachnospiraceae bacterium OF09-33XD]|nr:FHA domain-containing protein [Lachnospiraceae bacterium OF09-33XD]